MKKDHLGVLLLPVFLCSALSGCALPRPPVVNNEQIQYNVLIADNTNKQMVLNLVRERYTEVPFFIQAPSITSGLNYTASGSFGAAFVLRTLSNAANTLTPTVNYSIAVSPTTTYTPLEGEMYLSNILAETTLARIALLHRTGWNFDSILRLLVSQIGPLSNYPKLDGATNRPKNYAQFVELTRLLSRISNHGGIDFVAVSQADLASLEADDPPGDPLGDPPGTSTSKSTGASADTTNKSTKTTKTTKTKVPSPPKTVKSVVKAPIKITKARLVKKSDPKQQPQDKSRWIMQVRCTGEELDQLNQLIQLHPVKHKIANDLYMETFLLATSGIYEPYQGSEKLPVLTLRLRSFEEALFFLAGGVEVPPEDREKAEISEESFLPGERPMIDVKFSRHFPRGAFVAVPYRNYYFYIDDTDRRSKHAFTLLLNLFSLQAGNPPTTSPLLTIPVGSPTR